MSKFDYSEFECKKELGGVFGVESVSSPASVLACVGAASMDVAINYAFKWIEINFLDENAKNNYSLTDFNKIWKEIDKVEAFSSAAICCSRERCSVFECGMGSLQS